MQTWRNSELISNFWCNFRFFFITVISVAMAFCVSVFRACTLKFVFPQYRDYDEIHILSPPFYDCVCFKHYFMPKINPFTLVLIVNLSPRIQWQTFCLHQL